MLSLLPVVPASAEMVTYVSGSVGTASIGEVTLKSSTGESRYTMKSGVPYSGAFGVKMDKLRLEAAVQYVTFDYGVPVNVTGVSGYNTFVTYMVNGYYDVPLGSQLLMPYVSVGLGGANWNDVNYNTFFGYSDESRSAFVWQAGVGVSAEVSDLLMLDVGFRHMKPSSVRWSAGAVSSASVNSLEATFRFMFD